MNTHSSLGTAADRTREALRTAFLQASAAGDTAEMQRLKALAADLDAARRKAALGTMADVATSIDAIRAALVRRLDEVDGETPPASGRPQGENEVTDTETASADAGDPKDGTTSESGQVKDKAPETGTSRDESTEEDSGETSAEATAPAASGTPATEDTADPTAPVPVKDRVAWGAVTRRKHGDAFNAKVLAIAGRLGCDANYLMAVMAFETAETFSPAIRNGAGSGATGLIQFMPSTARRLGTTTARLAKMSALDQLDHVEEYFRTATRRPLRTLSDIYMAVLWPVAVGKAESHVLFRKPSRAYSQNHGFDVNRDGVITKAEAAAKVQQKLVKGMKEGRIG